MGRATINILKLSGRAGLSLWALGGIIIGASLMASHWVPLPHPNESSTLLKTSLSSRAPDRNGWVITHFLYADCPCSMRVLRKITDRGVIDGVHQRVMLIRDQPNAGESPDTGELPSEILTPTELARTFGIEAAPMFVVTMPGGTVAYSGGYTARKQGPDIRDTSIVASLRAGETVEPLPVFGCGVSARLRDIIDPLGIKNSP